MSDIKLELHPKAAENLNQKAELLLAQLAASAASESTVGLQGYMPDYHIAAELTDADILGDVGMSTTDVTGRLLAEWFEHDGKKIGLEDEAYKDLLRLSEQMQSLKELRTVATVNTVSSRIFEWVRERHKGTISDSMTEYVLARLTETLKNYDVWVPIAALSVQSDISIGPITFKSITAERFTEWFAPLIANQPPQQKAAFQTWLREQQKIQGLAAATISLISEPDRALEVALEEAEKAAGYLSFYHPANIIPGLVSYVAPFGQECVEQYRVLLFEGGKFSNLRQGLLDPSFRPWIIDGERLKKMSELDILRALIAQPNKSEFQEALLNALLLYARNTRAKHLSDKLLFIFTALDSFLLQDPNEPIQQNIADRMAFTVADKPKERMEIAETVKKAYGLRSQFVHHAKGVDDVELIQEFLFIVWRFFLILIVSNGKYKTKADLLNEVKAKRYA